MIVSLRAALHLRVSTARQAEHDVSIPDQKRQGVRSSVPEMADGVGFEPTVRLHVRRFSRPLP